MGVGLAGCGQQGVTQERFDWLDEWCENPKDDVIRTVGTVAT